MDLFMDCQPDRFEVYTATLQGMFHLEQGSWIFRIRKGSHGTQDISIHCGQLLFSGYWLSHAYLRGHSQPNVPAVMYPPLTGLPAGTFAITVTVCPLMIGMFEPGIRKAVW